MDFMKIPIDRGARSMQTSVWKKLECGNNVNQIKTAFLTRFLFVSLAVVMCALEDT